MGTHYTKPFMSIETTVEIGGKSTNDENRQLLLMPSDIVNRCTESKICKKKPRPKFWQNFHPVASSTPLLWDEFFLVSFSFS